MNRTQAGTVTVEIMFIILMGCTLVLTAANLVAWGLGLGMAHSAVDQAARAGAQQGVGACEVRADQVAGNLALLGAPSIICTDDGEVMWVELAGNLPAWSPWLGGSHAVTVTGQARRERSP